MYWMYVVWGTQGFVQKGRRYEAGHLGNCTKSSNLGKQGKAQGQVVVADWLEKCLPGYAGLNRSFCISFPS